MDTKSSPQGTIHMNQHIFSGESIHIKCEESWRDTLENFVESNNRDLIALSLNSYFVMNRT